MKDEKERIKIVEAEWPEGEARWCDRPKPIDIPGRPELGLFPDMLTWHYGNSLVERPYVRTVTYFPWLLSLRRIPDGGEFEMKYQSIHDPGCWISFKAAADGSLWRAVKFLRGENIGETVAPPGVQFFILLAYQGIADGEKHFVRPWPAEEIAATRTMLRPKTEPINAPGHLTQSDSGDDMTDIPSLCLELVGLAERCLGIGRKRAALMLIEVLRCELAAESPGSKPN
jgi:hypothetical protein